MARKIWFACYPNDLLGSLRWRAMRPAQRGAYWQLICWQMQSDDGTLPGDIETMSSLADLDLSKEGCPVLEAFPLLNGSKRRANPRAYAEWQRRAEIGEKRSRAGSAGMSKRYNKCYSDDNKCYPLVSGSDSVVLPTVTVTSTVTDRAKKSHPAGAPASTRGKPRSQQKIAWNPEDGFSGITPDDLSLWSDAYPAVNTQRNLKAMHAWLLSNPTQAHKSNWIRFITGWLSREQDRGGDGRGNGSKPSSTPDWKKLELLEGMYKEFMSANTYAERWTPEQKEKVKKWRSEIKALKERMVT